ncbi:MAG: NAD(P)H-hydrate dehydratase [Deltaproteobacteria bacterium]|nr:NAD(P)H-hydrate dehydratase [Deltaproteobacteria bacterium]
MKLVDTLTMRTLDRKAMSRYGIKGLVLMENAGRTVALIAKRELGRAGAKRVSIITGKGNNAGDGFVSARHLKNFGLDVMVYSLADMEELKGDARTNASIWAKMDGKTTSIKKSPGIKREGSFMLHSALVIDAIFGTGLDTEVKAVYAETIDFVNTRVDGRVISIDVPSGIDSTTGKILGRAIRADMTVTLALPKLGLYLYPGRDLAGEITVADIGMPRELLSDNKILWNLICDDDIKPLIRPRARDAHKGSFGHVLVIGGSRGKSGAPYMAAMSAIRSGAGLATIALPEGLNPIMEAKTTEVMTLPLPETSGGTLGDMSHEGFRTAAENKDAIVIGPGLGDTEDTRRFVKKVLNGTACIPLVIDADALNAIGKDVSILKDVKCHVVLTPHPGEMARLLGVKTADVQGDRIGSARTLARQTGAVVILKGAGTVIADKDGRVFINPAATPALATAGTGDILTGTIGAFLAQGLNALDSALVGVYLHGLAGEMIEKEKGVAGVIATDLLERLPLLINSFVKG